MATSCGTGGWTGPLPGDPDNNIILSTTPAFGGIDVSWTYPGANPHAVAHTLLWRGVTNNFSGAIQRAVVAGNVFYDKLPADRPYYYWINVVSINGTVGALIGPATATARPLIGDLITELTGQIDAGMLATSLRTPIDSISLLGSAVSQETVDRGAEYLASSQFLAQVRSEADALALIVQGEITRSTVADSAVLLSMGTTFDALNSRVILLDGGITGPALPHSVIQMVADQTALNQKITRDLSDIGVSLLDTVITANDTNTKVFDAGLYVDPSTGLVKITALEQTRERLSTAEVAINAQTASINLKASTVYVDNAIALAVLDATQVPVFTALETRVNTAEADINAAEAAILLRATTATSDAQGVRLTSAETNISAITGTLTNKVSTATYTADQAAIDSRLGTAESSLTALGDTSSISQIVSQGNVRYKNDNLTGEALLRTILTGHAESEATQVGFANARTDLTTKFTAELEAEASARTTLAGMVAGNAAAILDEKNLRVTAVGAEATARLALGVALGNDLSAAIQTEAIARGNADGSLFAQYTVKLDVNGYVSGFGLASTVNNTGDTSSHFAVRADRFSIGSPGQTSVLPFIVQSSPTVINGKAVAAGVYMDTAYIRNGTLTSAHIGSLDAGDIKTGSLIVGLGGSAGFLTSQPVTTTVGGVTTAKPSTDFNASWNTVNGYYLGNQAGTFKFYVGNALAGASRSSLQWDGVDLDIKGKISATSGDIGGVVVNSLGIRSPDMTNFTTGSGFWLGNDGRVQIGNTATGSRMVFDGSNLDFQIRDGNGAVTAVSALPNLYTVKLNANGLIGGFGIASDPTGIQAGFDVDTFFVGRTNANKRNPFIISGDEVFVDKGVINELTFSSIRNESGSIIGDAAGKLKATHINARGLTVISDTGVTGFNVDSAGNAFFRGTLGADTVTANSIVSRSATSMELISRDHANGSQTLTFYMDHSGIVWVQVAMSWNSNNIYSYSVQLTFSNGVSPGLFSGTGQSAGTFITWASTYLSAGWHSITVAATNSAASGNHRLDAAVFRSYR